MSFTACVIDALPATGSPVTGLAAQARRADLAQAVRQCGGHLIGLDYRTACERAELPAADVYKFDAPGQNEALDHWLLGVGAAELGHPAQPRPRRHGELHARAIWFAGWTAALTRIEARAPAGSWVNRATDILVMTDKWACQQRLQAFGIPIPKLLGLVTGFEALLAQMDEGGLNQVFVKPRYGSSGSGVVALRRSAGRWRAHTALRVVDGRLFNQLDVRVLTESTVIGALIDALVTATPCYAEAWIPKPRAPQAPAAHYDLRVVAWLGRARQRIARISTSPISNLHLGNQRAAPDWLSPVQLEALHRVVHEVAAAFPAAQVFGLDLIVLAQRVLVLEVNAFGDHLRGVASDDGATTTLDQARHWQHSARQCA